MRDPQFYAQALRRAASAMPAGSAGRRDAELLAHEWQDVSNQAGELKHRTWQLISDEVDGDPWYVASHPALEELWDNMRRNDVS